MVTRGPEDETEEPADDTPATPSEVSTPDDASSSDESETPPTEEPG